jgi:hypothetical protein
MPGIEPGALEFSTKTLRPPILWRINDQLRPIQSQKMPSGFHLAIRWESKRASKSRLRVA